MEKRVFGIHSPEALERMLRHPEHDYKLQCDIDMGGKLWNPPACFESMLNGNGKKISNVLITEPAGGGIGFFGTVAENAGVRDLVLENITVRGCDSADYVGGVAGLNRGTIENVTVTGDLSDSRDDGTPVGAIAGRNEGVITGARSELTITVPQGKAIGLAGQNTGTAQGIWRDRRYSDRCLSPESIAMRKTIVDHSYRMGTYEWKVPDNLDFISPYIASCSQYFRPGETYCGLPYTNKYGSFERFLYCLDETGTVKPWVMALGSGHDGFDRFMGADCSGNIYWAWGRVCSCVSFKATPDMVPLPEHQEEFSVLPVGDYVASRDEENRTNTLRDIEMNGQEKMLECLAQLRFGDAIVNRLVGVGGHTKLVAEDPTVYRSADGTIDRDESILITHELGGTGPEINGGYSRWALNRRNKFSTLLKQGYIPITNPELKAGKRVPVQLTAHVTGPASGTVESNYRIISTTVTLEQSGEAAMESVKFTAVAPTAPGNDETAARTSVRKVDMNIHAEDLKNAPKGEYTYKVKVLLSTGKTYTVHEGICTVE